MATLTQVILFSLIGGVFSLIGGVTLLSNKTVAKNLAKYATPFAAGALLAAAFIDLLPESGHSGDFERGLAGALLGIIGFFLLEKFLKWFHHHHEHESDKADPSASLIVIGDTIHNFIDGIAIGAAFLVSIPTGVVATIAVAAHEIPQEIGDFGLLLKKRVSRKNVVMINIFSALATTVGAVLFFQAGNSYSIQLDFILGLVAGFFIYIAVSDIIPSIHRSEAKIIAGSQTLMLLLGVIVVSFLIIQLHKYIEVESDEESPNRQLIESYLKSENDRLST
ncbi:ZIP family metal transporter [Candidatus Saccharibacteria bacterium CPR2]|nr:ZIP family metal transporter [Candidatus Saccharibacteria bacterium CPR2]